MPEPYGGTALIPPVSGASHTPGFFFGDVSCQNERFYSSTVTTGTTV